MKPIKVSMQAFGSYTQNTVIDFTKFYDKNIFLITGSTGSGKTTILDAMCFALYCRATGGLRTWKDMRNSSVDETFPTIVDFEFTLNNETYRFARSLKPYHKRNSETIEFKSEHSCFKKVENLWELIISGSEAKVREYAEFLLGLDCTQFSMVIVLPQGEFKNLLLANTNDKSKIFQKLFSTSYWDKLSKTVSAIAKSIDSDLNSITIKQDTILKKENIPDYDSLIAKNQEYKNEYIQTKENLKNLEQDISILSSKIENLKKISSNYSSLKKNEIELKKYEKAVSMANEKFESAKQNSKQIPILKDKIKHFISSIAKIEKSLESYKKLDELDKLSISIKQKEETLFLKTRDLKNRINTSQISIKKEKDYLNSIYEETKQIPKLFLESENLKKILESYNLLTSFKEEQKNLQTNLNKLENKYESQTIKIQTLQNEYDRVQKIFDMDKSYSLSLTLKPGWPCPVCGSTTHPKPAIKNFESDSDYKTKLDSIKLIIDEEKSTANDLKTNIISLTDKLNTKSLEINKQIKTCQTFDLDFEQCKRQLKEVNLKLENAKIAESQINTITKNIENLQIKIELKEKELKSLEQKYLSISKDNENINKNKEFILSYIDSNKTLNDVSKKLSISKSNLKNCELELQNLENALSTSKSNLDIAKANLKICKQNYEIDKHNYESLIKTISKDEESNIEVLEKSFSFKKAKIAEFTEYIGRIKQLINSTEESIKELSKIELTKKKLSIEYSKTNRVALFLQGKNPLNMQIQTFVLGIMLDDVLRCANIYLASFSQNRYALSRITDPDRTSKKGYQGLDIEVFDSHCGYVRAISTLSGGELFLASLSLALGLSDVVQSYSGSVHLDSIFIDEGFGSLDHDTLDVAMETLQQIRKMGRLIGVISHVKEIKEQVPFRIEVFTSDSGIQKAKIIS